MTSLEYAGYLRYEDKVLDEESLKIVQKEIKETKEIKEKCLDILKKKLKDEENLNPCLQEEFLLAFLRVAKYDVNKTYDRIIRFHDQRLKQPDIFLDYLPSTVKIVEIARKLYAGPYRLKEDKSALIILKRITHRNNSFSQQLIPIQIHILQFFKENSVNNSLDDYDPSIVHYDLIIRFLSMVGDVISFNELNQMCGITILLDLKSSSWSSSWSEYTPSRLKLIATLLQKVVPLRVKGIHIVNYPPIYYLIYTIIYPFLSNKIKNRIILHKDYQNLHSHIDPKILPKEYDGHLEKSDLIDMFQKVYDREDFFLEFSKCGFIKKC